MTEVDQAGMWTCQVHTPDGDVIGYRDGTHFVWKGIPYAAATDGEHRFRAPRPVEPWAGARNCRSFGDVAPQGKDNPVPIAPAIPMSEDCLSVNVWAIEPDGRPRPVMVWIHGGAYSLGSSAQSVYDGRRLAELGDLVLVTVNYRVGAFGFLDLSSFSTAETVFETNLGLRDQIAALEWVQRCVESFGGDPSNVTVFGESSGGASVTTLMTSPKAEGLFHRAIVQSAPATSVYGPERAAVVATRFLELVDITPDRIGELKTVDFNAARGGGRHPVLRGSDAGAGHIGARAGGRRRYRPAVSRCSVPEGILTPHPVDHRNESRRGIDLPIDEVTVDAGHVGHRHRDVSCDRERSLGPAGVPDRRNHVGLSRSIDIGWCTCDVEGRRISNADHVDRGRAQ